MKPFKPEFDEPIACRFPGCERVFEPDPANPRAAGSAFSAHLQYEHRIKAEEYTVKYIYDGIKPTCQCEGCSNDTRYVTYKYKPYCKQHSKMAMSDAGKRGGSAPNPLKGKTKHDSPVLAAASERMKGDKNHFYGKHHTDETRRQIASIKRLAQGDLLNRLDSRKSEWLPIDDPSEYRSRQCQYLRFECVTCHNVSHMTLQAYERGSLCKSCYKQQVSAGQKDLADWISKTIGEPVELSTKRVISPLELDVYVEPRKFAVEYHGLYFHSEAKDENIDRRAMLRKHKECHKRGIKLYQFLANEWCDKRAICESMMSHALGASSRILGARECELREISKTAASEFFEQNHINGNARCRAAFGLFRNDELLVALSLRKPQGKSKWRKGKVIEVARFASKQGTSVRGGLGKLMSHAKKYAHDEGFDSVLTYADLRFGHGNGYAQVGFELVGETGPMFVWTDLRTTYGRQTCKADLANGLREADVAEQRGLSKIWLPGSNVYMMYLA